VFIIFDSHPRPSHPNGAGMTVSTSIECIARRLTELLPTVDLPEGVLQWQAQLLSHCSGHVFVPHSFEMTLPTLWQAVLESSLAQLSMQAEIADLRSQNEFQTSEQQRLERELKKVEERSQQQEGLIRQLQSSRDNVNNNTRFLAAPKHSSSSTYQPSNPSSSKAFTSDFNSFSSSSPPSHETSTAASGRFASLSPPSGPSSAGLRDHPRGPPTPSISYDDDCSHALHLQREYDAEDRALAAQRNELSKAARRVFRCGVCMDEMPEDSMACPDSCGHMFCRECLRGHVSARLEEHRFPILCPTCTAGKGKGKGVTGGRSRGYSYILLKFTWCLS
jgi:hypothetical protein